MKPRLTLIAALTRTNVIGRDGALPWRQREDLRRFKRLTSGHPVIMGRKTWDTLGVPLPDRTNIVLTRDRAWSPGDGAIVVHAVEDALARAADAPGSEEVFILGGGEIYRLFLDRADRLELTRLDCDVPGDTYFPEIPMDDFERTERSEHPADEKNEHPFAFETWQRKETSDS